MHFRRVDLLSNWQVGNEQQHRPIFLSSEDPCCSVIMIMMLLLKVALLRSCGVHIYTPNKPFLQNKIT